MTQEVQAVISVLKTVDSSMAAAAIIDVSTQINPDWTLGVRWDSAQDAWSELRRYVFKGERLWPALEAMVNAGVLSREPTLMALLVIRAGAMRWVQDRLEGLVEPG